MGHTNQITNEKCNNLRGETHMNNIHTVFASVQIYLLLVCRNAFTLCKDNTHNPNPTHVCKQVDVSPTLQKDINLKVSPADYHPVNMVFSVLNNNCVSKNTQLIFSNMFLRSIMLPKPNSKTAYLQVNESQFRASCRNIIKQRHIIK